MRDEHGIFILIWIAMITSVFGMIIYAAVKSQSGCIQKKVVTVGGCNSNGGCGAQFEDGSFGRAFYPVVGQLVCPDR